jgi:hypothetical protein
MLAMSTVNAWRWCPNSALMTVFRPSAEITATRMDLPERSVTLEAPSAVLVDSQVTNHFADVAYFDVIELGNIGEALSVPFNSVTVSCPPDVEALSALI